MWLCKIISSAFGEIELKTLNFIMKFGITSLFLLTITGLTGCDISPEKHNSQAKLLNNAGGHLNQNPVKARTQSFDERGALI